MKKIILSALVILLFNNLEAQITNYFRTTEGNTNYHHFVRNNSGGAAVYINQAATLGPILRLSSGTTMADQNVKFSVENNGEVNINNNLQVLGITGNSDILLNIGAKSDRKWTFLARHYIDQDAYGEYPLIIKRDISNYAGDFVIQGQSGVSSDFVVKKNGNVGIGTITTGTHKLAVEGTIGAREIIVETGTWSDFVFEPAYKLKTLEEVEKYIKTNKHLPDVPSEKEVKENGLSLGQSDAVLLQKIEELTLYLIEQNKSLKAQNEKIIQLEAEIKEMKNN